MSKFHSTISRRDFMKGLGLAGAGIGAAAATAPVFHDLDEVASSPNGLRKLPWYIKERELLDPTVEIDWNLVTPGAPYSYTPEEKVHYTEVMEKATVDDINKPGCGRRDYALRGSFPYPSGGEKEGTIWGSSKTLTDLGTPKWQGTPEENFRILTTAAKYFGSPLVGASVIDEKTIKCLFPGRTVWDDTDEVYRDEDRVYHIPRACKYVFSFVVPQTAVAKYTYSITGTISNGEGYPRCSWISACITNFIHNLGWMATQRPSVINVPFGILSGCGELGRVNYVVSPTHGALVRKAEFMITDLPLPPTKPIDAGIHKFCESCGICADLCPSGSLTKEREPSWEGTGPWNGSGIKAWWCNWKTCYPYRGTPGGALSYSCNVCQGVCVFSKADAASVHEVIRGVVGTTSAFNSFFATMDNAFGYGEWTNPEEFWECDMGAYPYRGAKW